MQPGRVLGRSLSHRLTAARAAITGLSKTKQRAAAMASDADHYLHGLTSLSPDSTIAKTTARLGPELKEVPLEATSAFVKPRSVLYTMDGKQRRWDVVESHPSVGVVLYHSELDAFIIVRQFRPAVWVAARREARAQGRPEPPLAAGFTHELCAGLVDKSKSLAAIASEEVAEECGYALPPEQLAQVTCAVASSGISGANHTIFYGRVDESMRINPGGGLAGAGEAIEVLALPLASSQAFVLDSGIVKSPGLMFGLLWAYHELVSGELSGRAASADTGPLLLKPVACA